MEKEWTNRMSRMACIFSPHQMERLHKSHVMIFGLGGVGSYAAEALCRAGIGHITLVDADIVEESNLNRQLPALYSTLGMPKVEIMANRLSDIAPDIHITAIQAFHLPSSPVPIPLDVSFVIDAVDTVAAKIDLAEQCYKREIPFLSCMGMGNRKDPTAIHIGDLFETSHCPLCRVMRRELRKKKIEFLRCVYSTEDPCSSSHALKCESEKKNRPITGSVSYVPSVAGLYMAFDAVKTICD